MTVIGDAAWVAKRVDISCVRAEHTAAHVRDLAEKAVEWGFVSAHVLPHWLPALRVHLQGSAVLAGSPVGFPAGGSMRASKLDEAKLLLSAGVQELDFVINIGRLKSGELDYCLHETRSFTDLVAGRVPTRLILEVSLLDADEIKRGCDIAVDAGVDYVKTGTGWEGPTTVEHVELIAEHVRDAVAIKAAGGVRTVGDIERMTDLGVTRFGVNHATAIGLMAELSEGRA